MKRMIEKIHSLMGAASGRMFAILVSFLFFLTLGTAPSLAGEPESMGFTRVIQDPVSAAMGGAGVVVGNAWSSYRNVAALPFADCRFDVALGYQDWCASSSDPTSDINVGLAWNLGKNKKVALAAGFTYGICKSYDVTDKVGNPNGTFTPSEIQANLGFAWRFVSFLSLGVNFKYLSEKLASNASNGAFSTDIFLNAKVSDFKIALGVSSLGSSVESVTGKSFSLSSSVTLGGGYGHEFGKHGLDVLLDADYYYNSSTAAVAFGAGYTYNKHVSVRAGYHYGSESRKNNAPVYDSDGNLVMSDDGTGALSGGSVVSCVLPSYVSIGIGGAIAGLRLDFSYLIPTGSSSPLKNTFALALGYSF